MSYCNLNKSVKLSAKKELALPQALARHLPGSLHRAL
jgi:hypothetical protein